jgi:hypothetical protein
MDLEHAAGRSGVHRMVEYRIEVLLYIKAPNAFMGT